MSMSIGKAMSYHDQDMPPSTFRRTRNHVAADQFADVLGRRRAGFDRRPHAAHVAGNDRRHHTRHRWKCV